MNKQIKRFEDEELKSKSKIEDLSIKIRQLEERLKTLPKETFNIENETTLERTKNLSSCNYNNNPVMSNNSNYKSSLGGKTPATELNTSYSWRLNNNQGLKNTIAATKARSKEKTELKSRALSSNKEERKPLIASFKPSIVKSKYNNFSNYNYSYHNNTNCSNNSQSKGYVYNLGKANFKKSFTNVNSVTSVSNKKPNIFSVNSISSQDSNVVNSKNSTSGGKFTNLYNKNFIENNEKKLRSHSFNKVTLNNTNLNNTASFSLMPNSSNHNKLKDTNSNNNNISNINHSNNSNNSTHFNYKSPVLTPNKSYTHFFKNNTKNPLSVKNRSRITVKTPFQNLTKNNFTKSFNLNSYRQSSNNNTNGSYNNSKNSNNLINSYFDFFNSMKAVTNHPSTYNSKQISLKSASNNNNSKYEEETTVINNTNKKLNIPNMPDKKKKVSKYNSSSNTNK